MGALESKAALQVEGNRKARENACKAAAISSTALHVTYTALRPGQRIRRQIIIAIAFRGLEDFWYPFILSLGYCL